MGYSRTITDGNARHAQLNASPSIPSGSRPIKDLMKAVASPRVGILKKNKKIKKTSSSQAYVFFSMGGWAPRSQAATICRIDTIYSGATFCRIDTRYSMSEIHQNTRRIAARGAPARARA